jgi:hypothetical protein
MTACLATVLPHNTWSSLQVIWRSSRGPIGSLEAYFCAGLLDSCSGANVALSGLGVPIGRTHHSVREELRPRPEISESVGGFFFAAAGFPSDSQNDIRFG